jgi:polysaccharide transporter, PST family
MFWLALIQAASYVCPLLNVVFLARALGPSAWGTLATFQALASWFSLIIEYGFSMSATREVAENRHRPRTLGRILSSVLWAKIALTSALVMLVVCAMNAVPLLRDRPQFTFYALLLAVGPSFTPAWFYQGLERIRAAAIIDLTGRIAGTTLTVLLVRDPSQLWMALLIPGFASLAATALNHARLYRHYSFLLPSPRLVWHALAFGWTMFLYRSSVSLYTIGNAFLLALFVSPKYVAYYAAAERIARYSTAVLTPLSQALYPRITYLVRTDLPNAAQLATRSFRIMIVLGAALGGATFLAAPLVTRLFLGHNFGLAVPVLRVLSLLPPLVAVSNFVGFQWLLPLRKDSVLNIAIFFAGLVNVALILTLSPHFHQYGAAWAVVSAETLVSLILLVYLKRNRLFPARIATTLQPVASITLHSPAVSDLIDTSPQIVG